MGSKEDCLLEETLKITGSKLETPVEESDALLNLLVHAENQLSKVEQSPSESMHLAIRIIIDALVAKELLNHPDSDVRVGVVSCLSEIMRITAPEAPYDDETMKVIFQRTVEVFQKLDDLSSRSYARRASILETFAKIRLCVVMLDLECDDLVLDMFQHFLGTIRSEHSETVLASMEAIMSLVIEESEEVSEELASCLLKVVKNENMELRPVAYKLGEKVINNCTGRLKSSMVELVRGSALDNYSKVVSTVLTEASGSAEHEEEDDSKQSERTLSDILPQGSEKSEQEVGCPEEVNRDTNKSSRMSRKGIVAMRNGESVVDPSSPEKKTEHDNHWPIESVQENPNDSHTTNPNAEKDGRSVSKIGNAKSETGKGIAGVSGRRRGVKKAGNDEQLNGLSNKKLESFGSHNGEKGDDALEPLKDAPEKGESTPNNVHHKKRKSYDSKATAKKGGSNVAQKQTSVRRRKFVSGSNSGGVVSKETEKSSLKAQTAADGEIKKHKNYKRSSGSNPKTPQSSSPKRQKRTKAKYMTEETEDTDESGELLLKEFVSSKSAIKALSNDKSGLNESSSSKRKRTHAKNTENHVHLDESLVGAKVRVWWPDDDQFYNGRVESFDPVSKKHKVIYDDDDVEELLLADETWEFIGSARKFVASGETVPDDTAASDRPRSKRVKKFAGRPAKEVKSGTPKSVSSKKFNASGSATVRHGFRGKATPSASGMIHDEKKKSRGRRPRKSPGATATPSSQNVDKLNSNDAAAAQEKSPCESKSRINNNAQKDTTESSKSKKTGWKNRNSSVRKGHNSSTDKNVHEEIEAAKSIPDEDQLKGSPPATKAVENLELVDIREESKALEGNDDPSKEPEKAEETVAFPGGGSGRKRGRKG